MLYILSRPALKGMVRRGNNVLQICKQLAAAKNMNDEETTEELTTMREAMGVLQHHDAVSGTAKQAVTFDYAERLHSGFLACENVISKATSNELSSLGNEKFQFCHMLNISQCHETENNDRFVVNVYNPLPREISRPIRLPVKSGSYIVSKLDETDNITVKSQLVPLPKSIYLVPGRNSHATHELVFIANKIPPMGNQRYHIEKTSTNSMAEQTSVSFLVGISISSL
jgi:lysosomal alpha-mannosidase